MISGKLTADFSSFEAAVAKAETSLKGFEQGAGKVEGQLNRVANSLSGTKLISDATVMAEAVERIGGVSKLTEQELARLSAQAREAGAKLVALGQDVPPGLQKIADAGKATGGIFGDLSNQVKATALGFVSAQGIIGAVEGSFRMLTAFVGSSIESYASAEAAAKKMTTALQAQGTATPDVIDHFNDLAGAFQRTTVYSDDLINEMQALLTSVGNVAPGQMQKALSAATDLAAGLGIDLHDATLMVAKASDENVSALKKAGVQLDETRVKGEGMSYILGEIEKKFGGQAQGAIETYAGKIKQIANAWDNVQEVVGGAIANDQMVAAALRAIKDGADGAASGGTALAKAWGDVVATLPTVVRDFGAAGEAVAEFNNNIASGAALMAAAAKTAPAGKMGAALNLKDDSTGLLARAKSFGEKMVAGWKQEDAAAAQHAGAIESMFRKLSGADATAQMRDLDTVFRRLADSGKITEQQVREIAKQAAELSTQGATLTPRLMAIALETGAVGVALDQNMIPQVKRIGQEIAIAIPELDAFSLALKKMSELPDGNIIPKASPHLGTLIPIQIDELVAKSHNASKAVGELAQAFMQMAQGAGGSLGLVLQGFGQVFGAIDKVKQATIEYGRVANKTFADTASLAASSVTAMIPIFSTLKGLFENMGFGGLSAADEARAKAADQAMRAQFTSALALAGSLTELQKRVEALGYSWDKVAQGFTRSRGDIASTGVAIDRLGGSIADFNQQWADTPQGMAEASYKTTAELQAIADKAQQVYDYMLASGKYSAGELARAFEASTAAQKAALSDSAKSQQDALDAISAKYADTIGKLDSEMKSLSDSIAKEAPEEFMGIVEAQERARLADLANQKRAQEAMRDAEIAAKQSTFEAMFTEGQKTDLALRKLFGQPLEIPYRFVPQNGPDGGGATYTPTTAVGRGTANGLASAQGAIQVVLNIDGRMAAEALVPHIPDVVQSYGL